MIAIREIMVVQLNYFILKLVYVVAHGKTDRNTSLGVMILDLDKKQYWCTFLPLPCSELISGRQPMHWPWFRLIVNAINDSPKASHVLILHMSCFAKVDYSSGKLGCVSLHMGSYWNEFSAGSKFLDGMYSIGYGISFTGAIIGLVEWLR